MSLFATILPFIKTGATSTISRLASQQITKLVFSPSTAKTFQRAYDKALSLHQKGEKAKILSDSYSVDILERIAEIDTLNTDDESKRFLKLLAFELLQNTETVGLVLNYKIDAVLHKLENIENELKDETIYNHNSFIESNIDVFIPRTLTRINQNEGNGERVLFSHEQYSSIINDNQYVVVLANAGMGKSTLLKQIAIYIAKDKIYYPVFVNLNSYSADQPLNQYIEIRYPQIKKIQKNELLFILDGFDEIGVASDVKKIHDLKEVYKESKILLSSRYSHYKNTLSGFEQYYLNDISIEDIHSYINEKYPIIDLYSFMKEVGRVGIEKLIYNPFFLNIIIKYYIGNESKLPKNKQSLIHGLLRERLILDKEHFRGLNIDDELIIIENNARRLSLIMAMMSKRAIKEKELQFILQNREDLQKLKSAVPIKKDNDEIWSFEHAIFLENFASEALSCFDDFEELKALITYSNSEVIIDEWSNIVGYLVGILDISSSIYKEMLKWLIKHNPTVIAKIEIDKLTIDERDSLLKNIFLYHKEKTTWIGRDVTNSLKEHKYSEETIKFLFEEVCNLHNHRRVRLNAIELLEHIDFSCLNYSQRELFTRMLINQVDILKDEDTELLSEYLSLIPPLQLGDPQIVNELISILGHRNSSNIKMALCSLIYQWQQSDIHIIYILEITKSFISNRGNTRNEDAVKQYFATYDLESVIRGINKSTNLVALLKLYTEADYDRSKAKDIFKTLLNQAELLFDDSLYRIVLELFYKKSWWLLDNSAFIEFIERMDLNKRILYDIFERERDEKKEHPYMDILIKDKEDVDVCFKAYDEGIWELWKIDSLYRTLLSNNKNLADYIFEQLQVRYQHTPKEPKNYDKERVQRKQKAFDILINIPQFKAECLKVFDDRRVETISYKEVFEYKFRDDDELSYEDFENSYNHAVETRFRMCKDDNGNIEKQNIISYFADKNMELHQIAHIYDVLIIGDRDKEIIIRPNQLKYLEDWFKRYIDKTPFAKALSDCSNNSYSFDRIAIILIGFLKRFDFDCPMDKLSEMTYLAWESDRVIHTDNSFVSLAYLEERIGEEELSKQIVRNIQKEEKDRPVKTILENHLCYIVEKKVKEHYSLVLNLLLNSQFDKYAIDRVLNTWFESEDDIDILVCSLDKFPFYNQLTICQQAVKLGMYELVSKKTEQLIYELDNEKYIEALKLMLKAKDLRGLEIYVNNTRLKKMFPTDKWDARDIFIYEDIKALPYYLQLLELSWKRTIGNTDSMKGIIIEALKNLGVASIDNCKEVIESINIFMVENINRLEDITFLNDLLDELNHFLLRSTYLAPNIKEAVSIIDGMNKDWCFFI
ncbi:NACHT domain-containing protein [Dysgonomonas sp. Marseille-P4677]|uniref:NACHT domain-containing protein n=1 Tax=Dysgonomonas sp. Marseille-P4677 TaxID=2364790 RepID=UPI0019115A97|nr:NACHT domain-containing protein [Dysgonomonas sp. Marseille-P4677]MBK5719514.1 NACHT domain-containing protein [Dysgonomonas sp. Marseille-P4677]